MTKSSVKPQKEYKPTHTTGSKVKPMALKLSVPESPEMSLTTFDLNDRSDSGLSLQDVNISLCIYLFSLLNPWQKTEHQLLKRIITQISE